MAMLSVSHPVAPVPISEARCAGIFPFTAVIAAFRRGLPADRSAVRVKDFVGVGDDRGVIISGDEDLVKADVIF